MYKYIGVVNYTHKHSHAMGIFDLFMQTMRQTNGKPYNDQFLNISYEQIFCDELHLFKNENSISIHPWDILLSEESSIDQLRAVQLDGTSESRHKIIASNLLTSAGISFTKDELYGVVLELSQKQGLDVLATYRDGSARYINHSEKIIIWEKQTEESKALIDELLDVSDSLSSVIESSIQPRDAFPIAGNVRLSFLTNNGIQVYESPYSEISNNPFTHHIMKCCIKVMLFLTQQLSLHQPGANKSLFC